MPVRTRKQSEALGMSRRVDGAAVTSVATSRRTSAAPTRYPLRDRKLPTPVAFSNSPSPGRPFQRIYATRCDDLILNRYFVRTELGRGGYGTVVKAEDSITNTLVAVKVLHKDEDLNPDVRHEEHIYAVIQAGCSPFVHLFGQILDSGDFQGFHCIVFKLCYGTLHNVLSGKSGLMPLPARHIREISYQIIRGIEYLHSCNIVHTDLKPDNIAFKVADTTNISWLNPVSGFSTKKVLVCSQIAILDLGSAVPTTPYRMNHGRIASMSYRAPEVALGLPWTFGVDTYAIGCTIAEAYLGSPLFGRDIADDREHVATVARVVGPFSRKFATRVNERYPNTFSITTSVSVQYPPYDVPLTAVEHSVPMRRLLDVKPLSARIYDPELVSLLRNLLSPDPEDRPELKSCGSHAYFQPLQKLQLQ